jgi:hypothetical protein
LGLLCGDALALAIGTAAVSLLRLALPGARHQEPGDREKTGRRDGKRDDRDESRA